MKQFLVFTGDHYYPTEGWSDFVGSFNTKEEALIYIANNQNDWLQIVDIYLGKIIESGNRKY